MEKVIRVKHIHGITEGLFNEFKPDGIEILFLEEGRKAQDLRDKIIEYMVLSWLLYPHAVLYDLMKDSAKKYIRSLPDKIINLWDKVKDKQPALLKGSKSIEYKKPRISFSFGISEDEIITFDIDDQISNQVLEKEIPIFLDLIELKMQSRIKEQEIKSRLTIPIKITKIFKDN